MGIEADPRPKREIEHLLKATQEKYKKMPEKEREYFDIDTTFNPYADSRVLHANYEQKVKTILVGIDIETPELLLAKEIERGGAKIDLVIGHHPEGRGLQRLADVIHIQEAVFEGAGVPINVIQKILEPKISLINRSLHPENFTRVTHASEYLHLNLACFHTVCDNQAYKYLTQKICVQKYRTLGEILENLKKIPEYEIACRLGNSPVISVGAKNSTPGKIIAGGITGGTSSSEKIYAKLETQGIGTMLVMHLPEKHREEAEKHHINIIVCGHMASDSLGMNLFLDQLEQKKIKIIPCSGLIRISRNT
jgi:hypothetical protein